MAELRVRFDARAADDLRAAIQWYEEQLGGLGDDFFASVRETMTRILSHPRLYPKVDDLHRRALVSNFPFSVYYEAGEGEIVVVAVVHTSRHPRFWRNRRDEQDDP